MRFGNANSPSEVGRLVNYGQYVKVIEPQLNQRKKADTVEGKLA